MLTLEEFNIWPNYDCVNRVVSYNDKQWGAIPTRDQKQQEKVGEEVLPEHRERTA